MRNYFTVLMLFFLLNSYSSCLHSERFLVAPKPDKTISSAHTSSTSISFFFLSKHRIDSPVDDSLDQKIDLHKLDSVYKVLIENKEIILSYSEKIFYDYLKLKNIKDTIFLANIYRKTPTDNSTISYGYDLLKDDLVYYNISNLGRNKITEVSIIEGDKYRYLQQNLKKKSSTEGLVRLIADNSLTINVTNSGFLRQLGLFRSKLKIELKKVSPINIEYEEFFDSTKTIIKSIGLITDTIFRSSFQENLVLNPRLDITKNSELFMPVDLFQDEEHLVGWGYWFSSNEFDNLNWVSDQENDLIEFARQEILLFNNNNSLSASENENVQSRVNNLSLDTRTLNYSSNYAFFKTNHKIQKPNRKAEIILKNLSDIYNYNIKLGIASVYFKEIQTEREEVSFIKNKYIKLTINQDE